MENKHLHVFKDIVVPANCKENGYTLHKCDCGYEHKDNFTPLAPHSFAVIEQTESTCTQGGFRKLRCTVCGEERVENLPHLGHQWGDWQIQTFPTCVESGSQARICVRCGEIEEQTIPPKGHKLINPKKSETEKGVIEYFCENCGEIIKKPAGTRKFRDFLKKHRKGLIVSLISLILVAVLVFGTVFHLIPRYHYWKALDLIEEGAYTAAYHHLIDCHELKEATELLSDFDVNFEEIKYTFYDDGEIDERKSYEQNSTYKYDYDEKHRLTYLARYNDDEELEYEYVYTYDKNGNLISELYFNGSSKKEYKYNDKGDTISYIYYGENNKIESKTEYEYTYDKNDNILIKIVYEDGLFNLKEVNEYDNKGNEISNIVYDQYGRITSKNEYEYKYDDDDNLISRIYFYNGKLSQKTEYEYNCNGNLISYIFYDEKGNIINKVENDFYCFGGMKRSVTYDKDGKLMSEREYYKNGKHKSNIYYDKKGEIINKEEYNSRSDITYFQIKSEDGENIFRTYEYEYFEDGSYIEKMFIDGKLYSKFEFSKPVILYNPN